jgi:hypothetical protein
MDRQKPNPSEHVVRLWIEPTQVLLGQLATLRWKVAGNCAKVTGVQLSSSIAGALSTIENTSAEGARQVIFACPGMFAFTLTATFSDGVRRCKRVGVLIQG